MDELISVVVTTYNRQNCLRDTINAILKQTYQNFEVIVVDNYSNYDFYGFIDGFHSEKIRAFQNQNNGVIAVNRNFGVKQARGGFIAFCDDDDIWLPNKLELQISCLKEHNVDLVSSSLIIFGESVPKEYVPKRIYKTKYSLYFDNYFTPSAVLLKNSDLVRFSESPTLNCAEDWTLFLELILSGYKYYQMQTPLVRYRIFASNMTKKNNLDVQLQRINVLKYLKQKYKQDFQTKYYIIGLGYQYSRYLGRILMYPILPMYRYIKKDVLKKIM